jgi:hypothetical protein
MLKTCQAAGTTWVTEDHRRIKCWESRDYPAPVLESPEGWSVEGRGPVHESLEAVLLDFYGDPIQVLGLTFYPTNPKGAKFLEYFCAVPGAPSISKWDDGWTAGPLPDRLRDPWPTPEEALQRWFQGRDEVYSRKLTRALELLQDNRMLAVKVPGLKCR